jgi:hypothetical protein
MLWRNTSFVAAGKCIWRHYVLFYLIDYSIAFILHSPDIGVAINTSNYNQKRHSTGEAPDK